MTKFNLRLLTDYQIGKGGSPFFDSRNNAFYYVDVTEKKLHKTTLKDKSICSVDQVEESNKSLHECSLIRSIQKRQFDNLTDFVIPVEEDENLILTNIGNELVIYDFDNSIAIDYIKFDNLKNDEIYSCAKCDNKNRLFIGTFIKDYSDDLKKKEGSIYRLDGRNLCKVVQGLYLPSGLAWSNDSRKFFFIDSVDRVIYQGDYDLEKGVLSNQSVLIDLKISPFDEFSINKIERPADCVIDQDDNLWIALCNGGRIIKFDTKTCKVLESVKTGFLNTTAVCFAKIYKEDVLFVTSAKSICGSQTNFGKPLIVQTKDIDLKPFYSKFFKFSSTK